MEEENFASQILMEDADDSLPSLPRQSRGSGAPGPFTLPNIGGQWVGGTPWSETEYPRHDSRGSGRQDGVGWREAPGKKQDSQNVCNQAGTYNWEYRQAQGGQQGDAVNVQQPYYFMNPWAMQQAAASAMLQMGKDPTNPQHWAQMSMYPGAGGKDPAANMWTQQGGKPQLWDSRSDQQHQYATDQEQARGRKRGRKRRSKNKWGVDLQRPSREAEEDTPLPPNCSALLEEFRTQNRKLNLMDIKCNVIEFATDQYGSRFIQEKLDTATSEEKDMIEMAVLEEFQRLTTDVFGNYVVQKMFEYGSPSHRRNLAEQLVGDVLKLSLHMYGCRVIQKALESVSVEQQMLLIGEIKNHVLQCVEDQNGNHVIQKCIERMPPEKIQFIVNAFQGCVQRMACHCYGCRVLQRLIEHCTPPQQVAPILDEIVRCIPQLSQDQFGNYVVQHMLEHGRANDRRLILEVVRSQILMLSTHKFASNVVEKAIMCSSTEDRMPILHAIIGEPSDVHPALHTMMRDRYGNYIVQRLLELSQDAQKEMLLWRLKDQVPVLKKFTYGKHIVQALEERATRI